MRDLYLIDASGWIYRSYFAIRNMTNSKGESTNALFGFIRSVMKLMKDFKPTHMASVFDGPRNASKRVAIYSEYKAHRSEMPADLRYQIDRAHRFCDLMGIPQLNIPETEADDVMGTLAKWASENDSNVYLCTSDKDMCQLVNDKVFLLNAHKENQIIDKTEVEKIHGISPAQMIDFLAIVGDSSDNIPGLPGFGPKTAAELLKSFGSLDYILNHPEEIPGKKKQEIIIQEREKALISRQLATIDLYVEVPKEKDFFELKCPNKVGLKEFYSEMNFNSLIKELDSLPQLVSENRPQLDTDTSEEYVLVDDEAALDKLISYLSDKKEICFDIESTRARPLQAEWVGIAFAVEPKKAWYIPVNGQLGLKKVLEAIKPLFENQKIGFYSHNVKFNLHLLANYGIRIKNISFDTILASYILNSHNRQHSLDFLVVEYFGKALAPLSELIGKGQKQIPSKHVPIEKLSLYCCANVDYICRLKQVLQEGLDQRKLNKLLPDLELPLLTILAEMERKGIYLDVPTLQTHGNEIGKELQTLTQQIYSLAGVEFNINSPLQLKKILFEHLAIPFPKKRTKDFSTGEEILDLLKNDYPITSKILDYRKLEKLRSTYIESLPQEVNPNTHRIHCTFNQSVAATGRLSCQDPNLQNIPIRTEAGNEIRKAFRPEKKGWSYLAADYSQIELRLLAHMSEDPDMLEAFKNGEDIHSRTAAAIYNLPLSEITKAHRYSAKAVNFGIVYGQQAFGLSQTLNISVGEAAAFIETYFKRFKKVKEFLESCKEACRKTGKSVTLTGRERLIPEINSKNGMLKAQAERLAVNTPLQGSAADLIKMAMLRIDKLLQKGSHLSYLILQIHDELIFESPDFEIFAVEPLVKEAMENVIKLKVPLIIDVAIGKNWKEC